MPANPYKPLSIDELMDELSRGLPSGISVESRKLESGAVRARFFQNKPSWEKSAGERRVTGDILLDLVPGPATEWGPSIAWQHPSGWQHLFGSESVEHEMGMSHRSPLESFFNYVRAAYSPENIFPHMWSGATAMERFSTATTFGWEEAFGQGGIGKLQQLGVTLPTPAAARIASSLRVKHLDPMKRVEGLQNVYAAGRRARTTGDTSSPFWNLAGMIPTEWGPGGVSTWTRIGVPVGEMADEILGTGTSASDIVKRLKIMDVDAGQIRENALLMSLLPDKSGLVQTEAAEITSMRAAGRAGYRQLNAILPGQAGNAPPNVFIRPESAIVSQGMFSGAYIEYPGRGNVYNFGQPPNQLVYGAAFPKHETFPLPIQKVEDLMESKIRFGRMKPVYSKQGEVTGYEPYDPNDLSLKGKVIPPGETWTVGYWETGQGVQHPIRLSAAQTPFVFRDEPYLSIADYYSKSSGLFSSGTKEFPDETRITDQILNTLYQRTGASSIQLFSQRTPEMVFPGAVVTGWSEKQGGGQKQTAAQLPSISGYQEPGYYYQAGGIQVPLRGVAESPKNFLASIMYQWGAMPNYAQYAALETFNVPGSPNYNPQLASVMQETFLKRMAPGIGRQQLTEWAKADEQPAETLRKPDIDELTAAMRTVPGYEQADWGTLFAQMHQNISALPPEVQYTRFGMGPQRPTELGHARVPVEEIDFYRRQIQRGYTMSGVNNPEELLAATYKEKLITAKEGQQYYELEFLQMAGLGATVNPVIPEHRTKEPMVDYETMAAAEMVLGGAAASELGLSPTQHHGDVTALGRGFEPRHQRAWRQVGEVYRYMKGLQDQPIDALQIGMRGGEDVLDFDATTEQGRRFLSEMSAIGESEETGGQSRLSRISALAEEYFGEGAARKIWRNPYTGMAMPGPGTQEDISAYEFDDLEINQPIGRTSRMYPRALEGMLIGGGISETGFQAFPSYMDELGGIYKSQTRGVRKLTEGRIMAGAIGGRYNTLPGGPLYLSVVSAGEMRNQLSQMARAAQEAGIISPGRKAQRRWMAQAYRDLSQWGGLPAGGFRFPGGGREGALVPMLRTTPELARKRFGLNLQAGSYWGRSGTGTAGHPASTGMLTQNIAVSIINEGDEDADLAESLAIARATKRGLTVNQELFSRLFQPGKAYTERVEELVERRDPSRESDILVKQVSKLAAAEGRQKPFDATTGRTVVSADELQAEAVRNMMFGPGGSGQVYNLRRLFESAATVLGTGDEAFAKFHGQFGRYYQQYLDIIADQKSNIETIMSSSIIEAVQRGETGWAAEVRMKTNPTQRHTAIWQSDAKGDSMDVLVARQLARALESDLPSGKKLNPEAAAAMFAVKGEDISGLAQSMQEKGIYNALFSEKGEGYIATSNWSLEKSMLGLSWLTNVMAKSDSSIVPISGARQRITEKDDGTSVRSMRLIEQLSTGPGGRTLGERLREKQLAATAVLYNLSTKYDYPITPEQQLLVKDVIGANTPMQATFALQQYGGMPDVDYAEASQTGRIVAELMLDPSRHPKPVRTFRGSELPWLVEDAAFTHGGAFSYTPGKREQIQKERRAGYVARTRFLLPDLFPIDPSLAKAGHGFEEEAIKQLQSERVGSSDVIPISGIPAGKGFSVPSRYAAGGAPGAGVEGYEFTGTPDEVYIDETGSIVQPSYKYTDFSRGSNKRELEELKSQGVSDLQAREQIALKKGTDPRVQMQDAAYLLSLKTARRLARTGTPEEKREARNVATRIFTQMLSEARSYGALTEEEKRKMTPEQRIAHTKLWEEKRREAVPKFVKALLQGPNEPKGVVYSGYSTEEGETRIAEIAAEIYPADYIQPIQQAMETGAFLHSVEGTVAQMPAIIAQTGRTGRLEELAGVMGLPVPRTMPQGVAEQVRPGVAARVVNTPSAQAARAAQAAAAAASAQTPPTQTGAGGTGSIPPIIGGTPAAAASADPGGGSGNQRQPGNQPDRIIGILQQLTEALSGLLETGFKTSLSFTGPGAPAAQRAYAWKRATSFAQPLLEANFVADANKREELKTPMYQLSTFDTDIIQWTAQTLGIPQADVEQDPMRYLGEAAQANPESFSRMYNYRRRAAETLHRGRRNIFAANKYTGDYQPDDPDRMMIEGYTQSGDIQGDTPAARARRQVELGSAAYDIARDIRGEKSAKYLGELLDKLNKTMEPTIKRFEELNEVINNAASSEKQRTEARNEQEKIAREELLPAYARARREAAWTTYSQAVAEGYEGGVDAYQSLKEFMSADREATAAEEGRTGGRRPLGSKSLAGAVRSLIGGWGLFYLGHLASFPQRMTQYGYAEAQQFGQQMRGFAGAQYGGEYPVLSPEAMTLTNQILSGGSTYAAQRVMGAYVPGGLRDIAGVGLAGAAGYAGSLYVGGALAGQASTAALGAGITKLAPWVGLVAAAGSAALSQISYAAFPEQNMAAMTGDFLQTQGPAGRLLGGLDVAWRGALQWDNSSRAYALARRLDEWKRGNAAALTGAMPNITDIGEFGEGPIITNPRPTDREMITMSAAAAKLFPEISPEITVPTMIRSFGYSTAAQVEQMAVAQQKGIDIWGISENLLLAQQQRPTRELTTNLAEAVAARVKDVYQAGEVQRGEEIMRQLPLSMLQQPTNVIEATRRELLTPEERQVALAEWFSGFTRNRPALEALMAEATLQGEAERWGRERTPTYISPQMGGPALAKTAEDQQREALKNRYRDEATSRGLNPDVYAQLAGNPATRGQADRTFQNLDMGRPYGISEADALAAAASPITTALFQQGISIREQFGMIGANVSMPAVPSLSQLQRYGAASSFGLRTAGAGFMQQAPMVTERITEMMKTATPGQAEFLTKLLQGDPYAVSVAAQQGQMPSELQSFSTNIATGGMTMMPWGTLSFAQGTMSAATVADQIWGGAGMPATWRGTAWGNAGVYGWNFQTNQAYTSDAQRQAAIAKNPEMARYIVGGTMGMQAYGQYLGYQSQMAAAGAQMRQIALQEEYLPIFYQMQRKMARLGYNQQMDNFAYQQEMFDIQGRQFQENMAFQIGQAQRQRGWTTEDWRYQDQQRSLQWQWRQEDYAEQIRFTTGRERRVGERQMRRETTMHELEGETIDRQRSRQKELWATEDERFKMQIQHNQELRDLQQEQMDRTKEYYKESFKLQEQYAAKQFEYQMKQLEISKEAAAAQAGFAAKQAELAKAMMMQQADEAKRMDYIKIAYGSEVFMIQALISGLNHVGKNLQTMFTGIKLIPQWTPPSMPKDPVGTNPATPDTVTQNVLPSTQTVNPWETTYSVPSRAGGRNTPMHITILIGNQHLADFVVDAVATELEI